MEAIEIIKKEHREVEELFEQHNAAESMEEKHTVAEEIIMMLDQHTEMEEQYLYPKLRNAWKGEDQKLVEEAFSEHTEAKALIEEIKNLIAKDQDCDDKVQDLQATVTHHVSEEESELLPKAEKTLQKEELDALAREFKEFKEGQL